MSLIPNSLTIKYAQKTMNLEIKGDGNIEKLSNGMEITLNNVLYAPDLNRQWISIRKSKKCKLSSYFQDLKNAY